MSVNVKERLDIYLFRGKHPLYETLIRNPPENVNYLPHQSAASDPEEYSLYSPSNQIIRKTVDLSYWILKTPRLVPVLRRYDLVHSSRGFIVIGPNRYVVDVEHVSSFAGMRHDHLRSSSFRRTIGRLLSSQRCRALLPHSRAAENTLHILGKDCSLERKSTVVYPSVVPAERTPSDCCKDKPTVLFMGEYYWKGGREFLKACLELSKRIDLRVIYISLRVHPPVPVLRRAREILDLDYRLGPIPRRVLMNEVYPSARVFVMPTYIDTFGYAFLEAMACGVPCIGTYHFAVPEIIEEGVTGFMVKPPLSYFDSRGQGHPEIRIEDADGSDTSIELADVMDRLLSSDSLMARMSNRCIDAVSDGRFSVRRRNELLRSVYDSCIH